MILALSRATAGMKLGWAEFVALSSRTGYDGIDIDLGAVQTEGVSATKDLLAQNNLKPVCCGLPVEFRQDDETFNQGMKQLPEYARLAVEMECPRMATWVLPVYETPAEQMRPILVHRFSEIAKVLADHGIRLGLEFISPQHFRESGHVCNIWKMADMLTLCDECGDNVGLLLDCWHWHHDPDHSVQAIIDAGKDRIVTVHLNDSPDLPPEKIRDNERLLPGEGVIDLKGFLGALQQIGYADGAALEIFGRLEGMADDDAARQALHAAKKVIAEVQS